MTEQWGGGCVRASFVQQSVMTGKTRGRQNGFRGSETDRWGESGRWHKDRLSCSEAVKQVGPTEGGVCVDLVSTS